MPSQTELAKTEFLQCVQQIPGVSVPTPDGNISAEQAIRVVVPDVLGSVADEVYTLLVRIRRHYRNARLNVEIEPAGYYDDQFATASSSKEE